MPCNYAYVQTMNCKVGDLLTEQAASLLQAGLNTMANPGESFLVEMDDAWLDARHRKMKLPEKRYLRVIKRTKIGTSTFCFINANDTIKGKDEALNSLIEGLVPRWRTRVLQSTIKALMESKHTVKTEEWSSTAMTLSVKV